MSPYPLLAFTFVITALLTRANVTPISNSTSAILIGKAVDGEAILHQNIAAVPDGTQSATITGLKVSDGVDDIALIDGYLTSRSFTVRNEGSFLRHHLSFNGDLAPKALASGVGTVSASGTGEISFTFEITDAPMNVNFGFDFQGLPSSPSVSLLDSDSISVFYFPNPENSYGFTGTLSPGTYTVQASGLSIPESSAIKIIGQFAATIAIGEEPDEIPLPTPGSYTHPNIVTAQSGEGILQVENPQILSELDLGNGFTQFEVTASVRNLYSCPWPEVNLTLSEEENGGPDLEIITPFPAFSLTANELGAPPAGNNLLVQVATPDAATLRAQILDSSRFKIDGQEQPVFLYPTRPLEPEDVTTAPDNSPPLGGLGFNYVPFFESGYTVLEWESYYQVPRLTIIEELGTQTLITWAQGTDKYLPIVVADVRRLGTTFLVSLHDPPHEGSYSLPELLKDGTVTTTLTPEGHPENWGVTKVPETHQTSTGFGLTGFFPSPVPFHFNEVELPGGIQLSGSLGFKPELIEVQLDMRDATIRNLITRARWRTDCNLLLETSEEADNSAEPIAGKEATLLDLPLFSVQLPAGFSFNPRLELSAGATVNAPTSLSLPITGGFIADVSAGVKDGVPFTDADLTEIPLHVSDPGLYEALGITASAWIDCEIKALLGVGQGLADTGPTLGVRAQADFEVQPLADPWWTTEVTLSAFAGVEFDLFRILEIVDAEQTIASVDFFSLAADGPLNSPMARSFDPQPAFTSIGDPETRWGRSILATASGNHGQAFATRLPNSGDIITGQGSVIRSTLAKLSPEGELLWAIDPTIQLPPVTGVALPDDSFTVLGANRFDFRLANFDANGTLLWHKSISAESGGPGLYRTHDLLHRETSEGAIEYFLLGEAFSGGLVGFQIFLAKTDATGTPLWAKAFKIPPIQDENTDSTPGDFCLTADGDILIAAYTHANLPSGVSSNANITRNGHILKIDGDTGSPVWSTLVGSLAGIQYNSISEGPDGAIYVGGQASPNVLSDLPSMILTKLAPDGSLIDSALIGTVAGQSLPHGGESVYDNIRGMTWVDGHLWICGQSGIYNAGSVGGVAEGSSAFTAMISPDLDVSRFAYHATPASDSFHTIEATEKGLLIGGYSTSFHPWPGGAREGSGTPGSLLTLMLPWEGRMLFHPASAGRQLDPETHPLRDRGSFFVYPRVIAASQYTMETNQSIFAGLGQINITENADFSNTLDVTDITMESSPISFFTPTFIEPEEFKAIQFMPESLITDFDSFLDWHQIDSDSDGDGDGLTAPREYFHGTNPSQYDKVEIKFEHLFAEETLSPFVRFTMPRSHLADDTFPEVFSSPDLLDFQLRTDVTSDTAPLDDKRDWLFLDLPAEEAKQFFRLEFPE